jgi:hypothetical protein
MELLNTISRIKAVLVRLLMTYNAPPAPSIHYGTTGDQKAQ